jgi:NAD(P)-dependent dehydrogenase (short-subunit alcohol dehydrogenase family)
MYNLKDRVAVITGGGCGIGRAIALRFAEEGCRVSVIDVNATTMKETARQIKAKGGSCQTICADVRSFNEVEATVQYVEQEYGPADILVNNAGVLKMGSIAELIPEDWDRTFAINVGGVFRCTKAFLPKMMARKKGAIINMASWFGKTGKPDFSAYCASKFAVIGLTQSTAMEAATSGVRVNAVCPGTIVDTEMRLAADAGARRTGQPTAEERAHLIPMGRVGKPDDIARTVAFLASDEASYMTGQAINVTGGLWLN